MNIGTHGNLPDVFIKNLNTGILKIPHALANLLTIIRN